MTFWTCSACNMGLVFLGEVANRWPVVAPVAPDPLTQLFPIPAASRVVLAEYACQNPACSRRDKVVTVEEAG